METFKQSILEKTWKELFVYDKDTGEYFHPTLVSFPIGTVLEVQLAYHVQGEGETKGTEYLVVVVCEDNHYFANLENEVYPHCKANCKIRRGMACGKKKWIVIPEGYWWMEVNLKKLNPCDVDLMDITHSYKVGKLIYVKTTGGNVYRLHGKCRSYGLLREATAMGFAKTIRILK